MAAVATNVLEYYFFECCVITHVQKLWQFVCNSVAVLETILGEFLEHPDVS